MENIIKGTGVCFSRFFFYKKSDFHIAFGFKIFYGKSIVVNHADLRRQTCMTI